MAHGLEPRVVKADNKGPFTLDGTRTFLVGRERVAVIDPGPDAEVHVRALLRALDGASEVRILLTHHHRDHAEAAPRLARLLGAPVLAFPSLCLPPSEAGSSPSPRAGNEVSTDQGTLEVVETPGHTRDHLAFYWREAEALFVGDLVLGRGATTWVGEYAGCVADYLDSLREVRRLAPLVLYPSHGPRLTSPANALASFERHRLRRIDQVRRARKSHPGMGPEELVGVVYGNAVPPPLVKAARASVEMILHHLSREGSPP